MSMASPASHGRPLPRLLLATLPPIALTLILRPLLPLLLHSSLGSVLPLPPDLRVWLLSLPQTPFPALQASVGFAMVAFMGSVLSVPQVAEAFIAKDLKGRDLLKPGGRVSGPWIPECLGLPCASLYIMLMMLFIPFPFSHIFTPKAEDGQGFPQGELTLYLSSLLSLLTATLLGFIDDLFDIRWRHKLPIPIVASVPTLLVYYSEGGLTSVVLPKTLGKWLSSSGLPGWLGSKVIDLGPIYYLYLVMLPTFTTNSINILAGVNGVEVIQALIIALSVLLNDLLFIPVWPKSLLELVGGGNPEEGRVLGWAAGEVVQRHLMSAYFMLPLVGVCAGFMWHNWYPAKAFPGDTFCYFTGMAFSAVAIQGHFTKTLILFFIPQIFNFILSCPQLFHLVHCPRHRLPAYDASTDLLHPSRAVFDEPPPAKTRITLEIMEVLQLVKLERVADDTPRADSAVPAKRPTRRIKSTTNLTILNFLLVHFGPMHEQTLCMVMGAVQIVCSGLAFGIRYGLGTWAYGGDRR